MTSAGANLRDISMLTKDLCRRFMIPVRGEKV